MVRQIPGTIFDSSKIKAGHIWCLRCEAWIPLDVAFGGMVDPHIYDHKRVWYAFRETERRQYTRSPGRGILEELREEAEQITLLWQTDQLRYIAPSADRGEAVDAPS